MYVLRSTAVVACLFVTLAGHVTTAAAQYPMMPVKASGQGVTPVFEGWYKNPDGTFSLSFGYFNRNAEEVVDVPVGPDNSITPGPANQGQPTRFEPRRHWGVFAVQVPADFGKKQATWTLKLHGVTYAIPGHLRAEWEIDAVEGEGGTGNTPPVLRFAERGPDVRGPAGYTAGPLPARVGQAVTLTVWATDESRAPVAPVAPTAAARAPALTLTWFAHQGPGQVIFGTPTTRVAQPATTTATFSAPGTYIVRVRANDASGVDNAGHAQCCWTNGFIKVVVTP